MMDEQKPTYAFRVFVCGSFRLERWKGSTWKHVQGGRGGEWGGSLDPGRLLKKLVISPGRRAWRSDLVHTIWPKADPETALGYLHSAASILRRVLRAEEGTESLLITADDHSSYHLPGQEIIWVDADEALHLLTLAEEKERRREDALPSLEEAGALLGRGMFLEEEDAIWVQGRRTTLRDALHDCLLWQARLLDQRGALRKGEHLLRQMLEKNLTDEDALCRLMTNLHKQQRPSEALHLYHEIKGVCKRLHLPLTATSKAVAERLTQAVLPNMTCSDTMMLQGGKDSAIHETNLPTIFLLWAGSMFPPSLPEVAMDVATWFGTKVANINALVSNEQGQEKTVGDFQTMLYAEMERCNQMKQHMISEEEFRVSRRTALATLAVFSAPLLASILRGQRSSGELQKFFWEGTKSITACQQLLKTDGLTAVEHILPTYLPLLERLAQQPSWYQQTAAMLAAQGCLLAAIVALHRNCLRTCEACFTRAIEYSQKTTIPNLEVAILKQAATRFLEDHHAEKALVLYQQALQIITDKRRSKEQAVSPRLTALIYLGIAASSVQLEKKFESKTEQLFETAHQLLVEHPFDSFPYVDVGIHHLYLWEGLSYVEIGNHEAAGATFSQVESFASDLVPQRVGLEIRNHQTATFIAAKKRDEVKHSLLLGAQGAIALGSQKRLDEVIENIESAKQMWPRDKQIHHLTEQIFQEMSRIRTGRQK
jgi:DNA-binding SARP family transcriptional activator